MEAALDRRLLARVAEGSTPCRSSASLTLWSATSSSASAARSRPYCTAGMLWWFDAMAPATGGASRRRSQSCALCAPVPLHPCLCAYAAPTSRALRQACSVRLQVQAAAAGALRSPRNKVELTWARRSWPPRSWPCRARPATWRSQSSTATRAASCTDMYTPSVRRLCHCALHAMHLRGLDAGPRVHGHRARQRPAQSRKATQVRTALPRHFFMATAADDKKM